MTVVDASVLVASVLPDDVHHSLALGWLKINAGLAQPLIAPVILLPEVVSAVRRRLGSIQLANAAQSAVERRGFFTFHPVSLPLARRAAELAASLGLRSCDAVYVALAQQLDDVLVSFDDEQLERAAGTVRVLRPE